MTEEERKFDFIEIGTDKNENTFNWIKGIFSSWIADQNANYRNFFSLGLGPVTDDDLFAARASFQKGLDDTTAELTRRGLL